MTAPDLLVTNERKSLFFLFSSSGQERVQQICHKKETFNVQKFNPNNFGGTGVGE